MTRDDWFFGAPENPKEIYRADKITKNAKKDIRKDFLSMLNVLVCVNWLFQCCFFIIFTFVGVSSSKYRMWTVWTCVDKKAFRLRYFEMVSFRCVYTYVDVGANKRYKFIIRMGLHWKAWEMFALVCSMQKINEDIQINNSISPRFGTLLATFQQTKTGWAPKIKLLRYSFYFFLYFCCVLFFPSSFFSKCYLLITILYLV